MAHDYARQAQANAGVRQKRAYDTRCRGQAFQPGDKVWVFCPIRKKGVSLKLQSHWRGPGEILGRLSEVVYRVCMPGVGHQVVLHQDRLAPYQPLAPLVTVEGDRDSSESMCLEECLLANLPVTPPQPPR